MIVLLPCSCRVSFHARPDHSQNKRPIMTIITTITRSRISPWPHALSRLSFGLYRKLVVVHLHSHPTAARQLLLPALEAATEQSPESHNKWQQQQQMRLSRTEFVECHRVVFSSTSNNKQQLRHEGIPTTAPPQAVLANTPGWSCSE